MTKLSWHGILESQQKDFIQRLKAWLNGNHPEAPGSSVTLSHLDYDFYEECESYHSEIINIYYPYEHFIGLDYFCQKMADYYHYHYYNKNYEYEDCYANYLVGKIGEQAVKICLGALISDVDDKIHKFGDGGSDFSLTSNKNIKLQVKTRARARILQRKTYEMNDMDWYHYDCCINSQDKINEVDNISWSINEKEVTNNKVLICVLMLNKVAGNQIRMREGCSLLIAGFKPTDMINNIQCIKMKELFYGGGIRSYLESLV